MERAYDGARGGHAKQYFASRRHFTAATLIFLLAGLAIVCRSPQRAAAKSKAVSWKVIDDALLRVNDSPVKDWGVYQAGRKAYPLLLQMGNRILLIEIHERRMFEIDPSKVEHKTEIEHKAGIEQQAEDLVWDPADCPATPLATSNWVEHDVGGAFQIGAKIDNENRTLDLQLPHPPNIGDLPSRTATPRRGRY